MGIVNFQPDAIVDQVNLPETILEPRHSNFTSLVPESKINSLLQYSEGYPWTIDFYGQITTQSTIINQFDPSAINLSSPYFEVKKMVIQVTTPVSSNYNETTGITTLEGAGLIPYGIIPNIGDVFIANIDTGEDGIFIITSVNRKTHRKNTLYEVDYQLLGFKANNIDMYNSLLNKVQDIYYFNSNTNFFNRDVLITPEVKEASSRLNLFIFSSKSYYFSNFKLKGLGGTFIPNHEYRIYDHKLIEFILNTVDIDYNLSNMSLFTINNNNALSQPTILTAILNRDSSYLNIINRKYKSYSTHNLPNKTRFGTMNISGIDYIMYPVDIENKHNVDNILETNEPDGIDIRTSINNTGYNRVIELTTGNLNLFPVMFNDDYYIVSENFFNYIQEQNPINSAAISFIELLIYKHINKLSITKKDIALATEKYELWDSLQQFYYLPILWYLAKVYN